MLLALKELREEKTRGPIGESRDDLSRREARALLCRDCGAEITTDRERISVHGAHAHRRVNPSGVEFHLGCFRDAPGCIAEGEPTLFWTWFPGYMWQIACCARCRAHLGWAYYGDGSSFFGLIIPMLID